MKMNRKLNKKRNSVVFSVSLPTEHDDLYRIIERSENGDAEDDPTTCCKLCKCCTPCYASALCLPCRRLKKSSSCCNRTKKLADDKKATEIATSILNENEKATVLDAKKAKESCWKRMNCCKRKQQQVEEKIMDEMTAIEQQTTQAAQMATDAVQKERGKCTLCLTKLFCCRKTNKVQSSIENEMIGDDGEQKMGCCSCLPCRRKKSEPMAWNDGQQDSLASIQSLPKTSCCARLCEKMMCCKRKEVVESRRTSMNSKKQSIAPTLPPEDTRPKIDESLVDHTSVMKGAIPVLPVGLAWFCLICNCLIPGFGTICSGLFCLCLGKPRFSQHDGVRARIGSFFVNTFVGIAQAFTLIFCLVGWGWSIWWGMIMLRTARKHRKLLQASDADLEEVQTITSQSTSNQPILSQAHRDIEAGRHRN